MVPITIKVYCLRAELTEVEQKHIEDIKSLKTKLEQTYKVGGGLLVNSIFSLSTWGLECIIILRWDGHYHIEHT